jgi:hypothetical protein
MHHILTLGHHRIEMIEQTISNARRLATGTYKWHFLWQHYPLPNKAENWARASQLADEQHLNFYDAGRGLGCNKGIHFLLDRIEPEPGDFVTIFDPDERIVTRGWDEALTAVAACDRTPMSTVMAPGTDFELAELSSPGEMAIINGHHVMIPSCARIASVTCIRWDWWKSVGGYADSNRWYGGFEVHSWNQLEASGKRQAYLLDTWALPWPAQKQFVDAVYREWKIQHAHHGYDGSFEDMLNEQGVSF